MLWTRARAKNAPNINTAPKAHKNPDPGLSRQTENAANGKATARMAAAICASTMANVEKAEYSDNLITSEKIKRDIQP